ncbi:MAG: DNA-binding protein [Mycolicibacterium sp.]|nr:DNA-binding protein [Mycolicibacterium sp.]
MTELSTTATPATAEERAARAAESLAAEGAPVTNRAVRQRAGVAMTVAAEAARAWNEREAEQQNVPAVPGDVQARFEAIWRRAYIGARDEFNEARTGWITKVSAAEAEAAAMLETVADLEHHLDVERSAATELAQKLSDTREKAAQDLAEAREKAARTEGSLEAVTAERDRLLEQLESVRSTSPDERK